MSQMSEHSRGNSWNTPVQISHAPDEDEQHTLLEDLELLEHVNVGKVVNEENLHLRGKLLIVKIQSFHLSIIMVLFLTSLCTF